MEWVTLILSLCRAKCLIMFSEKQSEQIKVIIVLIFITPYPTKLFIISYNKFG